MNVALEWVQVVGPLIFSWPVAIIVLAVVFRDLIRRMANRFIDSTDAKAEFGPLKVQLGTIARESQSVLDRLHQFLELSARHRLYLDEILTTRLAHRFTPEQLEKMREYSVEVKALWMESRRPAKSPAEPARRSRMPSYCSVGFSLRRWISAPSTCSRAASCFFMRSRNRFFRLRS